jgi:clusterin-associated protein 1
LKELRNQVISKPFDLATIENQVDESIKNLKQKLTQNLDILEQSLADQQNLISKIEKKQVEYERTQKRLKSLSKVRPQYMDEFQKIEQEVVVLYQSWMEKFRNLAFLEQQLDELRMEEQTKFDETENDLKKMQDRIRQEELSLLRGENDSNITTTRPNRPQGKILIEV